MLSYALHLMLPILASLQCLEKARNREGKRKELLVFQTMVVLLGMCSLF